MIYFFIKDTLKNRFALITFTIVLVILIGGCSTKKNTWTTRNYQAMTTKFNVYFNGDVSYKLGLKNILNANVEDYSSIIPMYPISRHSNASSATSNMTKTIEKCRKAIKLHSIKVKPEKNYKKANDPEYKLFYAQEEFNPALKDAWLLLAKAEFHKADFLGSVGTFSYIARHYAADKEMVTACQLWISRAYGEMGWIYEAEQVLSKIDQNGIKGSLVGLFASTNADLLLKKKQYKDAIPFLELTLAKENDKDLKIRSSYLLAQLYENSGNDKAAYKAFTKVIDMNPPYEMDFYARINRTQLGHGDISTVRKTLKRMLKSPNNIDYLDQIYFALGNTYLQRQDTVKAIENYKLATTKSTRNGIDKGIVLVKLGDLYYLKKKYSAAQPCYDEAGKIISNEHADYARVTKRAEILSELVQQTNIVSLQDSLQRLSKMTEEERFKVVTEVISKLIADENAAVEKAFDHSQQMNANMNEDFANMPPIGVNPMGAGDWYFYNSLLIKTGKTDFLKKWGNRKLEDNWRRTNKASSLFNDEYATLEVKNDTAFSAGENAELADNHRPEYYLKQIPVTAEQIKKSNTEIANALFAVGVIYKDKIEDYPMAIASFDEFVRRFGTDVKVSDAYFNNYMVNYKLGDKAQADVYRTKIINEFPNSEYKKILSQPDYTEQLEKMYQEQDSIYNLTYAAYNKSEFKTVFMQVGYIQKNYPLSTLMPKFLFLNALSIGKNDTPDNFRTALSNLVADYPESDVSSMAKDIMALIKQGQEAKTGTTSGTLLARRDVTEDLQQTETNAVQFSVEKKSKHRLLLVVKTSAAEMNKLLYNIATFNFSRFMIKDFDLLASRLDSTQNVLSITNFESYDEVKWYLNTLNSDQTINELCNQLNAQKVIVSEYNYGLMKSTYNLSDYLAYKKLYLDGTQTPPVVTVPPVKMNELLPTVKAKTEPVTEPKVAEHKISESKPISKADVQSVEQPVDIVSDKPIEKPIVKVAEKEVVKAAVQPVAPAQKITPVIVPEQPKEEAVPLFKNLYAYKANEAHFVAIYIVGGTFDFEKTKGLLDVYNKQNYGLMNLKVSLEKANDRNVIIIGSLADAQIAKSYLLRMVKERGLFEGLKGADYRNLLGSQKNLNTLMQQNTLDVYFEFMQEYYLK